MAAPVPRARLGRAASRRTGCCRRSRRRSRTSAIDLTSQENVHLDLEERPHKSPRAFCAPIEVPDSVMLVIQPIGRRRRLARALPRGRAHRALRAHVGRRSRSRSKRLGDNAVTEGWAMLLQHLTDEPAWLTRHARLPAAAASTRRKAPTGAPLLRAALLRRSSSTRSSSTQADDVDDDARPLRRALRPTRSRSTPSRRGLPRGHRLAASTSPPTCARGPSRRSCATYLRRSSGATGSPSARPARSCASSGREGQRMSAEELLKRGHGLHAGDGLGRRSRAGEGRLERVLFARVPASKQNSNHSPNVGGSECERRAPLSSGRNKLYA